MPLRRYSLSGAAAVARFFGVTISSIGSHGDWST
jgi:hypothetical protein